MTYTPQIGDVAWAKDAEAHYKEEFECYIVGKIDGLFIVDVLSPRTQRALGCHHCPGDNLPLEVRLYFRNSASAWWLDRAAFIRSAAKRKRTA